MRTVSIDDQRSIWSP